MNQPSEDTFSSPQHPASGALPAEPGSGTPVLEAELVYAVTAAQRPYVYMYEPPAGQPRLVGEYVSQRVPIHDARPLGSQLSLDVHGFALHPHASALRDAYDPEQVRALYYSEMEQLMLRATGASRVIVFDHNVRSGPKAQAGQAGVYEPVRRVHNDYTYASAELRLRQLLGSEQAERRRRQRYAIVNVWRPLFGPVRDTPLAVCDARSIEPQDLVPIDLLYRDRVGENFTFAFNPRHLWYYVPDMQADEALLLKCFDSATDGRARFTAHTAFDDPSASSGQKAMRPRESIEIRTLVFYGSAEDELRRG
jgi:hypothetical protein